MPSMLDGDVGHILGGQRRALPAMIPREDGADLPGERSVGGFRCSIHPIDFDRRSAEAAPKCVVINPPDDSHVYRFFVGGRNLHIVMG